MELREKAINTVVTQGSPGACASYYAKGIRDDEHPFEAVTSSGPCHASLFAAGNRMTCSGYGKFGDIKWDILCTNIANNTSIPSEVAWKYAHWMSDLETSPWRDVFHGGFEIIERDGLPWAFLFENSEHLSTIPTALLFNLCIAARAPSMDGTVRIPAWYDMVEAGIDPNWAFLACGWLAKSRIISPTYSYPSGHWALNSENSTGDFISGSYNPDKHQCRSMSVWGARKRDEISINSLKPTADENSQLKTRFTNTQRLNIDKYFNRIKELTSG